MSSPLTVQFGVGCKKNRVWGNSVACALEFGTKDISEGFHGSLEVYFRKLIMKIGPTVQWGRQGCHGEKQSGKELTICCYISPTRWAASPVR